MRTKHARQIRDGIEQAKAMGRYLSPQRLGVSPSPWMTALQSQAFDRTWRNLRSKSNRRSTPMTAEAKAWVAYIEYHKQHPAGLPFSAFLMMEEGLCGDRIITSYGPNCDPFTATCDRDKGHDGQHIDHHDYANWESEAMSSQRRERAQRANAQHHEVKTITPRAYKCYMTDCAIPATEHYGWLSACKEHDLD